MNLDGPAGEQDDRAAGQPSGQVAHGVRLAGPRRPVQQQASFEVLAGAQQFPRPVGHPDDVPLDGLQKPVGQHDVSRRDLRAGQEGDEFVAVVLAGGEAEYLAAEHVVHPHQPVDLVAGGGGRFPVGREDLQAAGRRPEPALVADADHHRVPVRRVRGDQAEHHHLGVLLGSDGGGAVAGGAHLVIAARPDPHCGPGHEPGRAEVRGRADQRQQILVRPVTRARGAEPLRFFVPRREVGVDSPLDVHVLPGREPLGHRHHGGQRAAEVPRHPEARAARTPRPRLAPWPPSRPAGAAREPGRAGPRGPAEAEGQGCSPGQQCRACGWDAKGVFHSAKSRSGREITTSPSRHVPVPCVAQPTVAMFWE